MPPPDLALIATLTAQAMAAALMALLLYGFNRQYQKSYLAHWSLGWTALTIHHVLVLFGVFLSAQYHLRPAHPLQAIATVVGSAFAYLEIGWLVFGAYELVRQRPVRLRQASAILFSLAFTGALISFIFVHLAAEASVARTGLRGAVAAIAFVATGIALWRIRKRRDGFGFAVLSASFFTYGLEQTHYGIIAINWLLTGEASRWAAYFGYVDVILQTSLGLGMVACLLEDEREEKELATVRDRASGLPRRHDRFAESAPFRRPADRFAGTG